MASLVIQVVKNLPAMQETLVQSLGREDPLEKGMATPSIVLVWRIPWTEEPGGLQSTGSQNLTELKLFHFHKKRKRQHRNTAEEHGVFLLSYNYFNVVQLQFFFSLRWVLFASYLIIFPDSMSWECFSVCFHLKGFLFYLSQWDAVCWELILVWGFFFHLKYMYLQLTQHCLLVMPSFS